MPSAICEECGEMFGAHTEVVQHHLDKHLTPEQVPFLCKTCDRRLATWSAAKSHLKKHPTERDRYAKSGHLKDGFSGTLKDFVDLPQISASQLVQKNKGLQSKVRQLEAEKDALKHRLEVAEKNLQAHLQCNACQTRSHVNRTFNSPLRILEDVPDPMKKGLKGAAKRKYIEDTQASMAPFKIWKK